MDLQTDLNDSGKLKEYDIILKSIIEKYLEYCSEWDKLCSCKINLKKTMICDIYNSEKCDIDISFKKYIANFDEVAQELYFDLWDTIPGYVGFSDEFKIDIRTKTIESVVQKIIKKMNSENGKFPIKKCINDLFGVRIIDSNYKNNIKFIDIIIGNLKSENYIIKSIDRNLLTGYKGYHIYIIRDNNTFPIEIQIWDKANEVKNRELHLKHKEDYVKNIIGDYNKY